LDELINIPTKAEERSLIQISLRMGRLEHQDRHNPESAPKFTAGARSTVISKSANPLDLPQKSTIRAPFKAKSVDPKTYSPPSTYKLCLALGLSLRTPGREDLLFSCYFFVASFHYSLKVFTLLSKSFWKAFLQQSVNILSRKP